MDEVSAPDSINACRSKSAQQFWDYDMHEKGPKARRMNLFKRGAH
jgi:hypothetical protein